VVYSTQDETATGGAGNLKDMWSAGKYCGCSRLSAPAACLASTSSPSANKRGVIYKANTRAQFLEHIQDGFNWRQVHVSHSSCREYETQSPTHFETWQMAATYTEEAGSELHAVQGPGTQKPPYPGPTKYDTTDNTDVASAPHAQSTCYIAHAYISPRRALP